LCLQQVYSNFCTPDLAQRLRDLKVICRAIPWPLKSKVRSCSKSRWGQFWCLYFHFYVRCSQWVERCILRVSVIHGTSWINKVGAFCFPLQAFSVLWSYSCHDRSALDTNVCWRSTLGPLLQQTKFCFHLRHSAYSSRQIMISWDLK
jgi:hypothetical protein